MLTVAPQRRNRPSLTPLIDVVFLLLIFFMIVSRLSVEQQAPLALSPSGATSTVQNDKSETARLTLASDGQITWNGTAYALEELLESTALKKDQTIILTLAERVTFQQTLTVLETLHLAGFSDAKLSTEGAAQ